MNIKPSYEEFVKCARQGNVVPVFRDLPADLETPVSVFLKLGYKKPHAFLLESVELEERLGRFSLIGMNPHFILEYRGNHCHLTQDGTKKRIDIKLLDQIERLLKKYKLASNTTLPPLVGGVVGYIGYELVEQFEDIKLKNKKGLNVPDAVLFFPTNLIAFDHIKHELKLIHLAIIDGSPKSAYRKATRELDKMLMGLKRAARDGGEKSKKCPVKIELRSRIGRSRFEAMVREAKGYIRAGDCIQIVLSQRFDLGPIPDDFKLYRALRSLNPSPYMFYFRHKRLALVGSSPEMLAKKMGRTAEIRPIAGTRPRGKNEREDSAYETSLKSSKKEMAEHLMLVDLGRNDLGRVCDTKSVRVGNFARVERYSHVMHLVSDIQATLKPGKNAFDLLRASFPAGTVAGAPKIRAMQIIDELEPEKRGPYAGSLGYFSLNGNMDMCITIRTIIIDHNQASVQAGAGIVNDSHPAKEFNETINKAKALLKAVQKTWGVDSL